MVKLIDLLLEDITPADIKRILKRTGDEQYLFMPYWKGELTPEECNAGLCDIFAEKFKEEYPEAEVWLTDWGTEDSMFGHVWVKYKGKYYDAETPAGVKDWKDIPFIQRVFDIQKKYPDDVRQWTGNSSN